MRIPLFVVATDLSRRNLVKTEAIREWAGLSVASVAGREDKKPSALADGKARMWRGQRGGVSQKQKTYSQKEGEIGSRENAFAKVEENQRVRPVLNEGSCIALL